MRLSFIGRIVPFNKDFVIPKVVLDLVFTHRGGNPSGWPDVCTDRGATTILILYSAKSIGTPALHTHDL